MQRPLHIDPDLQQRRVTFANLLARAERAPEEQRGRFLSDAARVAHLHECLTGTPLWPDIAAHPAVGGRLRRLRAVA